MNRFLIPRTQKWATVCSAILMGIIWMAAYSAHAEKKDSGFRGEASVGAEDADHARMLEIPDAKKRMETSVGFVSASLTKALSKKNASELQKCFESCSKWNEHDAYIFFAETYQISPGYEKFKINAHPNPHAVGIFAAKNIVAMSYIPTEDFFEEDCKHATNEGTWLGPYRNTRLNEEEGTYQIRRKSMFYKKIPHTNQIIVGVVIQGGNKTHTVTERPNRFIAHSSQSLETERSGLERMARIRRNAWKKARRTFAD